MTLHSNTSPEKQMCLVVLSELFITFCTI